jgi:DNA-binding response OmpR family regulator
LENKGESWRSTLKSTPGWSTVKLAVPNSEHPRILLVEDDAAMAATMVRALRSNGYEVELATDGERALALASSRTFALALLDLRLPFVDGYAVLERLRKREALPVIVVTAGTELSDRMKAFELGAVDFLAKPFWIEELLARVQLRLKRPKRRDQGRKLALGSRVVDLEARTVAGVELTRAEYDVLLFLLERRGQALTREFIASGALAQGGDGATRTVDSHVGRIRKKLGAEGRFISTVWGVGYRCELTA